MISTRRQRRGRPLLAETPDLRELVVMITCNGANLDAVKRAIERLGQLGYHADESKTKVTPTSLTWVVLKEAA